MVRVENLSRSFGEVTAVDNLSFEVNSGEIFALLGPNGAGKTTTIKMILGMLRPDSGTVFFDGAEITPDDTAYKTRTGYVPETGAMYETLSGREYLEFIGNLHHIPERDISAKAEKLFDLLDFGDAADKLIREYSKGMKQKMLIVSALLHDPDLIILDEPFSGIDANAVSVLREVFREEARQGKAIIFCSHILEVVERLVDRILIIKDARQLITGTPDEIVAGTGLDSLERAFNELTDARDIDSRVKDIITTLNRPKSHD